MADLFTVTAPLMIRFRDGRRHVIVEKFPHPDGLLYMEPFWNLSNSGEGIHLACGEMKGEGPWKVGDAVITVLGCQGTNPEEALTFNQWQEYRQQGGDYPDEDALRDIAAGHGALARD